jgi:hypothetical protein
VNRHWVAIFIFGLSFLFSGPLSAMEVDGLSQYDIRVSINPEGGSIEGTVLIDFKNNFDRPLSKIYLRLANLSASPNHVIAPEAQDVGYVASYTSDQTEVLKVLDGQGHQLRHVFEDERQYIRRQRFSYEKNLLFVSLGQELAPGDRVQITVFFASRFRKSTIIFWRETKSGGIKIS